MIDPKAVYSTRTVQYNPTYEGYNDFGKTYGKFINNGSRYEVSDQNTPRQWLNFMVNEDFGSVVANDGAGYIFYGTSNRHLTKYNSDTDYLIRTLNGKRLLTLTDETGKTFDFFKDSKNFRYTVCLGSVLYTGELDGIACSLRIFVPLKDSCECWLFTAEKADKKYTLTVGMDARMEGDHSYSEKAGAVYTRTQAVVYGVTHKMATMFAMAGGDATMKVYEECSEDGFRYSCGAMRISKAFTPGQTEVVLSGAIPRNREDELPKLVEKYTLDCTKQAFDDVEKAWEKRVANITCELPDKNVEYFLNYWLKNQIHMTLRYNRNDIMGWRDSLQDAWGHICIDSKDSRAYILEIFSMMHADGRCPRQYDRTSGKLDDRDFMDSPIWACDTIVDYIKETGDFSILDEELGYLEGEHKDSLLCHLLRAFDTLWAFRGKNGLLLSRDGDWLDGLSGINKYGEATTVWGTIQAFRAQNTLEELLRYIGDTKNADILRERSAEYKRVVNAVGWDGEWYVYAFIDDEPIGSRKCNEGKIYLQPQAWAMLSGIYDSEDKLEKMYRGVHTYLSTMYGPMLLYPPYIMYGERCGRIQKHKPGTFSNAAIYLHGATFKMAGDCAVGRYDEALDTYKRILPNHPDTCDGRRTSEPYVVGNVYFGIDHECFGLNLYTWFTGTCTWLFRYGYEMLLGVKAEFDGLRIEPRDISGWNEYKVNKLYKGTMYEIAMQKGEEKGTWVDGKKWNETLIRSDKPKVSVKVVF